jgi:hypothetical protein
MAAAAAIPTESDTLLPSPTNGGGSRRPLTWTLWSLLMVVIAAVAVGILVEMPGGDNESESSTRTEATDAKTKGHRYTATQFISFTINTLGGLDAYGECDDRLVDPDTGVCYLGQKNLTADVRHRMKIVEQVLERLKADAYKEDPDIDSSPNVLKIFMMPEFFWRGPNGAYSTEQLLDDDDDSKDGLLIQVADRARDLIAVPEFEDYLFVFGTVIAAESANDPYVRYPTHIHIYCCSVYMSHTRTRPH